MSENNEDSKNSNSEVSSVTESNSSATSSDLVKELTTANDKLKQDFLYLKAEFETYKRNAIKERSDLVKYGPERFATEMLGIMDNFERALALQVNADNMGQFVKGMEMTYQEMKNVMGKFNIQELASEGKPFDPNVCEALSAEESSDIPSGHVTRVFKKAYKMHDKLIRPGQVVVAK